MDLDELRREHARERIGEEWLAAVTDVCRTVSQVYPPELYASSPQWSDAIDDLVQDVVCDALLRDGQAEYLMHVSRTERDFRTLLARQVRHVLAHRRKRTVVDRLLERSKPILAAPPFHGVGSGRSRRWTVDQGPTERPYGGLKAAVASVRAAARVPSTSLGRAPTVFTTETLETVLRAIGHALGPFSTSDLDRVLTDGLTPFLPVALDMSDWPGTGQSPLRPEDALQVKDTATLIIDQLDPALRTVLVDKLLGLSDADVAARLGVSRPTAAGRKRAMHELIEAFLRPLPASLHTAVMDELSIRLLHPAARKGSDA